MIKRLEQRDENVKGKKTRSDSKLHVMTELSNNNNIK